MRAVSRLALSLLFVAWLATSLLGQSSGFLSGARFQQQLAKPASIFWTDVPISSAISELSKTQKVYCWLDRRLDPQMPISFSSRQSTLGKSLLQLGTDNENLDIAWLGGVVYFGPDGAADRIATIHQLHERQLDAMPNRFHRAAWRKRKTMRWDKLATPKVLVERLERELGSDISGRELVPHDLWNAGTFPGLPLHTRLELVLAGFDLTFEFTPDGGARLVKMPEQPVATWNLKIARDQRDAVHEIVNRQAAASLTGDRLKAPWHIYQLVNQTLQNDDPNDAPRSDRTRYTLQAQNQPVGPFLQSLCKQIGLECRFEEVDPVELQRRVSFEVREVSLKKLLTAIVETTPLQVRLTGTTVIVQQERNGQ